MIPCVVRNNLETVLRRVLFLRDADAGTLAAFTRAGSIRRLEADATLFREGDTAPALHIVVSGAVKLSKCVM